ncbi:MAG TPA: DMT family transporter [Acidimicrobiia bacterium]|nr:DMT family transporter [Acidimicrobiia bacterium]
MTAIPESPTPMPSKLSVDRPVSDREPFTPLDWSTFAALGLIWGSSFLLIKVGLESFHPGLITWARVALGAVALLMLRRRPVSFDAGDRRKIVLLSVLWVGIPFTLYPLAEQHLNSAVTGLLTGATPLFAGLFGAMWFNRPSGNPQRMGMAIGFAGVTLIAAGSGAEGGTAPLGIAMVLAATVCYGIATNMAGPLQHKYGSVNVMRPMLAYGALWTAPFGFAGAMRSSMALGPLLATLVLGVVGTGVAFVLMATLVGRVGGPRASFITYLIPPIALVLGAIFLAETVAPIALGGAALVLAASILASRAEK